ncbi:MAG: patatin-like phospholipase family protein [Rhodocyclaceae bacterium]|nr:patatin-like phospholipase family protein [Rhodocyclaceae bacterium]MBX3670137.1 patatin-like phospholipase family protein [Rhodocyclaceae bacterium]
MSVWGPLAGRFESAQPQRKMLALDGGGIRGVLTLEILAEIERKLAARLGAGDSFRLCDYFDYIGGTSTGAIIAASLARGMSSAEVLQIYRDHGRDLFDKAALLDRLKFMYKSEPIAAMLQEKFGAGTTLEPQHLKTLLLVVTQNVSTDSPWPISSNPLAKYNDMARSDCNLKIPLWQLVRASTAAPVYFPPEVLQWDASNPAKSFVFTDGGTTPYNCPAFLMYRMATQAPYRLNWASGEDRLLIVSVGTGAAAKAGPQATDAHRNLFSNLANLPGGLMDAMQVEQDTNCRTVGRCTYGAELDREIGDLIPRDGAGEKIPLSKNLGRQFIYARYNAELSRAGLDALGIKDIKPENVQKLDSVDSIEELSRVGKAVAKSVSLEHFGSFV